VKAAWLLLQVCASSPQTVWSTLPASAVASRVVFNPSDALRGGRGIGMMFFLLHTDNTGHCATGSGMSQSELLPELEL